MRVALLEDNTEDWQRFLEFVERYGFDEDMVIEVDRFSDLDHFSTISEFDIYDGFFLDIYLPDGSGVEAAKDLRAKGYEGSIVFITTSDTHYAEGFEVEALHYLIKPYNKEQFKIAIERMRKKIRQKEASVTIKIGRNEIELPLRDLYYASVSNHRLTLTAKNGVIHTSMSMSELADLLPDDQFLQCYRSYIINMNYVDKMTDASFIMKDGKEISIALRNKGTIKSKYMQHIFLKVEETNGI